MLTFDIPGSTWSHGVWRLGGRAPQRSSGISLHGSPAHCSSPDQVNKHTSS